MTACIGTMDASMKQTMEDSFKTTTDAWRAAAATEQGKAGLEAGCTAALGAMPPSCGTAAAPATDAAAAGAAAAGTAAAGAAAATTTKSTTDASTTKTEEPKTETKATTAPAQPTNVSRGRPGTTQGENNDNTTSGAAGGRGRPK